MQVGEQETKQIAHWAKNALMMLSIFLAALVVAQVKEYSYIGRSIDSIRTISTEGEGEVIAVPDIARFSYSVTEDGKTVAEAQEKAAKKSNDALAYLKKQGVKESDVKTESYYVSPKYEYSQIVCFAYPCPQVDPKLVGYTVSTSLSVKVRDLKKAGDLLTGVGALGVSNIGSLSFEVDDREKYENEARAKAIADAKMKARELSKNLDVRLVRISSYYDVSADPYYSKYGYGGDAYAGATLSREATAPEIAPGENKIVSRVNVVYEIR